MITFLLVPQRGSQNNEKSSCLAFAVKIVNTKICNLNVLVSITDIWNVLYWCFSGPSCQSECTVHKKKQNRTWNTGTAHWCVRLMFKADTSPSSMHCTFQVKCLSGYRAQSGVCGTIRFNATRLYQPDGAKRPCLTRRVRSLNGILLQRKIIFLISLVRTSKWLTEATGDRAKSAALMSASDKSPFESSPRGSPIIGTLRRTLRMPVSSSSWHRKQR